MNRTRVSTFAALTMVLALGGCSQPGAASGADPSAAASSRAVSMADVAFSPADLHVRPGDTVVWLNDDDVAHTVAFADDSLGASDLLNVGDQHSVTFGQPGSFAYVCTVHPDMAGTVTVAG